MPRRSLPDQQAAERGQAQQHDGHLQGRPESAGKGVRVCQTVGGDLRGISGSGWRRSQATKTASRSTPADIIVGMVTGPVTVPQPKRCPSTSPKTILSASLIASRLAFTAIAISGDIASPTPKTTCSPSITPALPSAGRARRLAASTATERMADMSRRTATSSAPGDSPAPCPLDWTASLRREERA